MNGLFFLDWLTQSVSSSGSLMILVEHRTRTSSRERCVTVVHYIVFALTLPCNVVLNEPQLCTHTSQNQVYMVSVFAGHEGICEVAAGYLWCIAT